MKNWVAIFGGMFGAYFGVTSAPGSGLLSDIIAAILCGGCAWLFLRTILGGAISHGIEEESDPSLDSIRSIHFAGRGLRGYWSNEDMFGGPTVEDRMK